MVKNILIINIGIFLIQRLFNIELAWLFGVHYFHSDYFYVFQYVTYMWLHSLATFWHVLGNMFAVFIFGPMLERVWGSRKFLFFYLATGVGAGLLYGVADFVENQSIERDTAAFVANPNADDFEIFIQNHTENFRFEYRERYFEWADLYFSNPSDPTLAKQAVGYIKQIYLAQTNGPMVGASGAVFGILMAFAMLFPNVQLMLLFPPIPVKAKYLVFFYGAFELYSEINRTGGDNVAHFAHLSGMLVAFLMLRYWPKMWRG